MRDSNSVGRGFGFVTYREQSAYDDVLHAQLFLRGKKLQAKRAIPPSEVKQNLSEVKLFVGGLARDLDNDQLVSVFSQYGAVQDCVIMKDGATGISRGFGFITFVEPSSVEEVLKNPKFEISGKIIECKRAQPASMLKSVGTRINQGQYRRGGARFSGPRGGFGRAAVRYGGQFGGYGPGMQFTNPAHNQLPQAQNYNNLNQGQYAGGMISMPLDQPRYPPAGFNQSNPAGYPILGGINSQSQSYNS